MTQFAKLVETNLLFTSEMERSRPTFDQSRTIGKSEIWEWFAHYPRTLQSGFCTTETTCITTALRGWPIDEHIPEPDLFAGGSECQFVHQG